MRPALRFGSVAAFVAGLLCVSAVPALAGNPVSGRGRGRDRELAAGVAAANRLAITGKLGSGGNQHAYVVRPRKGGAPRVLKLFQVKEGLTSDLTVRNKLAHIAENTSRRLRADHEFQKRFGDIIPHLEVAGAGATLQDFARGGVLLRGLRESLRGFAQAEATTAMRLAQKRLGGMPISRNVDNFVFDPATGRIVGWFDHLSHADLGKHLEVAAANGLDVAPELLDAPHLPRAGSLLHDPDVGAVYLVRAGRRWHVPDPQVFGDMGLRWDSIENVDAARMRSIPVATDLPIIRGPRLPGVRSRPGAHAARWTAMVESMLETAVVVHREPNAKRGANASEIVTLRAANGRRFRAIWKPASGDNATLGRYPEGSPFAGTLPYPKEMLFLNEIRAAKLAAAIGLGLVPPTVERTIGGQRGSLQLYVEGAVEDPGATGAGPIDRAAVERLRVFDVLIGHPDRKKDNVPGRQHRGRTVPIGIDNGLSFPVGTTSGLHAGSFPVGWLGDHVGPLLPETIEFIASIDAGTVARVLIVSGAEPRQVAHVLRRLERMKRDATFLEIPEPGAAGLATMSRRVIEVAQSRTQDLPQETLEQINRTIEQAQRAR